MKTRLVVRALIQRGDDALVRYGRDKVPRLPGGAVKNRETLVKALERELFEELENRATIGELVKVHERKRDITFVFKVRLENQRLFEAGLSGLKPRRRYKRLAWLPRQSVCGWNNVIKFQAA